MIVLAVGPDDLRSSKFFAAVRKATLAGEPVYDLGEWLGSLYVVVGYSEESGALVDVSQWYEG